LLNNANSLVDKDGSLRAALDGVRAAVDKLKGVEGDLDTLVNGANQNLDGRMKELSVVLQNLKVATTYLKAFSQSIGEKPNRLLFTGKPAKLPQEQDILKSAKPLPAKSGTQAP
jgi:hypothetical protein